MAKKKTGPKWKQCTAEGCRRRRDPKEDLCPQCQAKDPLSVVHRTTELSATKWNALDLEYRNALQGIALLKKDMALASQQYEAQQNQRRAKIGELENRAELIHGRYLQVTEEIADSVGLAGKKITIDPDTAVVRELRET